MKIGQQINQILLSAHSSFGLYLTITIQYSGYYHMFTTPKDVFFFYFHVCKEGFEMCILNTAVECILHKYAELYLTSNNSSICSPNHKLGYRSTEEI